MSGKTATFSGFAKLQEWSPSYVTKLKADGRLVLTEDGKRVCVEASIARIKETESGQPQHVAGRRHWQGQRDPAPAPETSPGEEDPAPSGPVAPVAAPGSRAYWERVDAEERARIRTIERRRLEGELVETAAVRAAGAEAGTVLRAAFENLADHLAPLLGEGDPERERRIHARLAEHVGTVLAEVSNKLKSLSEQAAPPPELSAPSHQNINPQEASQ